MKNSISNDKSAAGSGTLREFIFTSFAMMGLSAVWSPYMSGSIAVLVCCLCGIIAAALCALGAAGRKITLRPFVFIGIVVVGAAFFRNFFSGFVGMANGVITLVNSNFNTEFMLMKGSGVSFFDNVIFGALVVCSAAAVTDFFAAESMHGAVLLWLFVNFEFNLVLRVSYSAWQIIVMTTAFGVCWSLGNRYRGSGTGNAVFSGVTVALCTVVALGIWGGFRGTAQVASAKESVVRAVHTVRFGDDDLPDGDMTRVAAMHRGDGVRLAIDAEKAPVNNIYLYGRIGTEYNRRGWEESARADEEWNGIFRWLGNREFAPQLRYGEAISDGTDINVRVTNKSAERSHLYVPFTLESVSGNYRFRGDVNVASAGLFGTKNYSFVYRDGVGSDDILLRYSSGDESDFVGTDADSVYNAYVDSVYLRMDDETQRNVYAMFFQSQNFSEDAGLYSTISRIRTILELSAVYSDSPDVYDGRDDFVTWFMKTRHSADSPYYATLATLALRSAGYPARYAEGYLVSANGSGQMQVTSADGHAWSEVYLDNIGWVPIEFTPGFYRQSLLNKMTVEISSGNLSGAGGASEYKVAEEWNGSNSADDGGRADEGLTMRRDIMIKVVSLVIIALAAAIYLCLRSLYIRRKRKKNYASPESERYIFSDIMRIIRLAGVSCDDSRPYDCTAEVAAAFRGVRTEEYERMIFIMQKSVFGGQRPEKREIHALVSFYEKLRGLLYEDKTRLKKLKLRLIDMV